MAGEAVSFGEGKTARLHHVGPSVPIYVAATGPKMLDLAGKATGRPLVDLLGGRVQMSFQIPITVIPMIAAGKLRALAITGDSRLDALPQVPTFAEAGMPGYGLTTVTGMMAPAKTPIAIRRKINKDVAAILGTPSSRDFLSKQGAEPYITTSPEEMDQVLKDQIAYYGKIIKAAGIKFEP